MYSKLKVKKCIIDKKVSWRNSQHVCRQSGGPQFSILLKLYLPISNYQGEKIQEYQNDKKNKFNVIYFQFLNKQ